MPEEEDEDFQDDQLEETLETAVTGDAAGADDAPAAGSDDAPSGPGAFRRALAWTWKWHPLMSMGAALVLLAVAWRVYPEPELRVIPPAEEFYNDGLDRLYRVMNPDLPLRAATPADEALAARNALLNLLVFHRGALRDYPDFINPHLLLAEADFRVARHYPELADKYHRDALAAYDDALAWDLREDETGRMAVYWRRNFFDSAPDAEDGALLAAYLEGRQDELAMRRQRREDYIRFRQAESNLNIDRADLALPVLEHAATAVRARRREDLRSVIGGDPPAEEPPRRAFELGPDEYARLPFLLGMAYDQTGQTGKAKPEYQSFLASRSGGREHVFVMDRLAAIAMEEGRVYRDADAATAGGAFRDAAQYYDAIAASPDSDQGERDAAVLGSAQAYSALAGLNPPAEKMVVDALADAGGAVRSWLESFSGQALPRRTLEIPAALGAGLGRMEMIAPGPFALPAVVAGRLSGMAGGGMETPYSRRWALLKSAVDRYDRIATEHSGAPLGAKAAVLTARESWNLGLKGEAEARFKTLLDPLSSPEVNLAARLGLAGIALDRGDLSECGMLILGGRSHPAPLWLVPEEADWPRFAARLGNPANRSGPGFLARIWECLIPEGREIAEYAASGRGLDGVMIGRFLKAMNDVVRRRDFYEPVHFPGLDPDRSLSHLLDKDSERLIPREIVWRNRLLLEAAMPHELFQKASRGVLAFDPFPGYGELDPGGLTPPAAVSGLLTGLARAWSAAAPGGDAGERMRSLLESAAAYEAAVDGYRADPGELLPELAQVYERQAETREEQGNHREALSLTAKAGRTYLSVASRARGSAREMDALLSAADAFFRSGLLERSVEALTLFLDRFGYAAPAGSETAMSVARAENLLGRSHWFLGAYDKALDAFRRNVKRNTPERYKSIYYIGRVMMDQAEAPGGDPGGLGDPAKPLPQFDRDGDPVIESALQAFNFIRQDQNIDPSARAWRWSTFDAGRLAYVMTERERKDAEEEARLTVPGGAAPPGGPDAEEAGPPEWFSGYGGARLLLTEALDRYPLRSNGGPGLSVRVEPEDYADLMASRFEAEYMLANTLLRLADAEGEESLFALARAHLANLSDPARYADALFDPALDRFQLNAAVIREAVEGGNWNTGAPLPRTRLGDDEGPTHSPARMRQLLKNSMLLLALEFFQAAERQLAASDGQAASEGLYRRSYDAYQALYDRFGPAYGPQAMLGMADVLSRLGRPDAAANHYRMAENIARIQPADVRSDGLLDIGPGFWGQQAAGRLQDQAAGYRVP